MKRPAAIALWVGVWGIGVPVAHGLVPWLIAELGPSFPGAFGWLGVVPLGFGAFLLGWVALASVAEVGRLPEAVGLDWKPKLFLSRGPYARTRNPMYVGELALWLGWAIWFGSPLVGLCVALLFAGMQRIIRREERDLATQFGDDYRRYAAAVPRWIG